MTLPTELEERANAKESRERAGTRAREELARQNHLRPAAPAPDKSDPGGFFEHDPGGFFAAPPTPVEAPPPSGLRTAYAQPGDVLPNAQTWEREGVRAADIGQTIVQEGANALQSTTAMFGGGGTGGTLADQPLDPAPVKTDAAAVARYQENNDPVLEARRNQEAERKRAAAEPHAAEVGSFIGQIPAYAASARVVEDMFPRAPAGAGGLARVGRVAHGAARGALENAEVQGSQGGDPSDALAVGALFGAAPHAAIEGLGGTEDLAARALRGPADRAVLRGTGATEADLPVIQRRLGSVEEYADAVRRLRTSGQIPRGATPEQARAVAQQILGRAPGAGEPIMRGETQGAVAANPTVAERAASPDVAERGRVDQLTDLINEHHDQVAARRPPAAPFVEEPFVDPHATPPYVDQPPEGPLRARTNNQILSPEERAFREAQQRGRGAGTAPRGRRARVNPHGATAPSDAQIEELGRRARARAAEREAQREPGHTPPPADPAQAAAMLEHYRAPRAARQAPAPIADADIEALGRRTRELAAERQARQEAESYVARVEHGRRTAAARAEHEAGAARAAAPRPSDMEPLTRSLERRGSDIDQAAREAINALVERRAGLQGEELRNYQTADEMRRLGERGPGRGEIPGLEVPQGNPLNARYYLGRMIPRAANRALNSAFIDDLLTRVIRRGVHEQPGGHTPARHALSAVLTAYHQSGDRRGAAEHHRQVQTDPYYRDLTRRKSRE